MIYIETENKDAAFHFSLEEYIMREYPFGEPVVMIWQADKCAMLGSNQVIDAEIDIGYAKRAGIQIVRRSSGGGTIYTDMGTLLYTMIFPSSEMPNPMDNAKEKVAAPIVEALSKLDIPAKIEGRNDILVEGKKVSGLAQYIRHKRICTHGSLLYDADLETLTRVLCVDDEKIRSKALRSVRSRVTNLREYMPYDCSTRAFWERLKQILFCNLKIREHELNRHDYEQIEIIYHKKYGNPLWTYGKSPKFSFQNSKRFTGGKVEIYLDVIKGIITSCSIRGDFLGVVPIRGLEEQLENRLFQYQVLEEVIDATPIQPYLGEIAKGELLSCIFDYE